MIGRDENAVIVTDQDGADDMKAGREPQRVIGFPKDHVFAQDGKTLLFQ